MREKIGFQVVRVGIFKHVLSSAVVTGFVMLKAVMCGFIAEGEQKMIFLVMASAKKLACLGHKLFVAGQIFIRNLQLVRAFCNHVDYVNRLFARRSKLHLAVVEARDQRRIDKPVQCDRSKLYRVAGLMRDVKRSAEFPAFRQAHRRGDLHVVNSDALRIDHLLVPDQIENFGGRERTLLIIGDGVKSDLQFLYPGGYLEVEGVHVFEVALPRDFLASGLDVNTGQVLDGPGWAVISGDPFWIDQRCGAGSNRYGDNGMDNVARRVGCIDGKLLMNWGLSKGHGCE